MTDRPVVEQTDRARTPVAEGELQAVAASVQPETGFKADPTYKAELGRMDDLDAKVAFGQRMGADVERQYRALIGSHEQEPQSDADKSLAIAGRMRMMDAFANGGDRNKLAEMAVETATKYPEVFNSRLFLSMTAGADLQTNPQFKGLLNSASPEAQARFADMSQLREGEKKQVAEALGRMDEIDEVMFDPAKVQDGLDAYWNLVDEHEGTRQSRADRHIASAGRMRIIDSMSSSGAAPATMLETMRASMNMYPELAGNRRFLALAADAGAVNNADWMAAFTKNGGDVGRLKGFQSDN